MTDYLYTSQRNEAEIGLDFYVSRFYDPVTGHFIQADTIVPEAGSSKAYDRYGYVNNNPVRYNDPSGHCFTGAVADTVFCVFVAAMAIGAVVDGAENAIAQYQETGSIDWTEVVENAMEGAVIAGAPFVALAAAPTILSTTSYGLSSASSSLAKANAIPGAQPAAKALSQVSGSALAGSSAITNFLGSPFPGSIPSLPQRTSATDKTTGILVSGGRQTTLTSGWNGPASQMPQRSSGFDIISKSHVEGHAAALMHQNGWSSGILYINNLPCTSCTSNLPKMLPSGSTLRIVVPTRFDQLFSAK